MLIIGCDYHPSFQQIAWVDTESGDCGEQRLVHSGGEAERYYRGLNGQGAGGDGSRGTRTLVRGVTGGVEVRAMGRRPGADSGPASAEAQERPRGCATPAQITGGRSLSPGVGGECGESGCAPTALAPAWAGSRRGLQCRSPAAGTYQQARERSATFLAGGGGASRRPLRPRVATSLSVPGDTSPPRSPRCGHGVQ